MGQEEGGGEVTYTSEAAGATGGQTTLTVTFMCSRCGRVLGTYTGRYFVAEGLKRVLCLECHMELFGRKAEEG
jgi:hypothetical protein